MPVYEVSEWTRMWYDQATEETLPRIMLIGDSITAGYTIPLNIELAGKLHVDSIAGSKGLDHPFFTDEIDLFARQYGFEYCLIHFNNGLHRIGMDAEEYGRLYEEKVCWLMERYPRAKLTLATTTSVFVSGTDQSKEETNAIVRARNEKVWEIARKYGLPVDDLYALSLEKPQWHPAQDGCHFNDEGLSAQAQHIGQFVLRQLDMA